MSEKTTESTDMTIRFHVDRRGRILIENFDDDCVALARALAPDDPVVRALVAAQRGEDRR